MARPRVISTWTVFIASCLLATALAGISSSSVAHARASHPLTQNDFYNLGNASFETNYAVGNQSYTLVVGLGDNGATISVDTRNFPGYNAVTFGVGADDPRAFDATSVLQVFGDGKLIASFQPTSASVALHPTVQFQGHHIITFVRKSDTPSYPWRLTEPTLLALGAPPLPAPQIVLASRTIQGGTQQTIDVSTVPGRQITMVIIYANGSHMIAGPQLAGPTGHDIYTFFVPRGVMGTAQVVAIVKGVGLAQTTFTVS